jgi:hypothetical protein
MDQITVVDDEYYENGYPVKNKIIWYGNQFKYIDVNGKVDTNPQLTQSVLKELFQAQSLKTGETRKTTMWGNDRTHRLGWGGMRRRNKRSNKRNNKRSNKRSNKSHRK